MLRMEDSQSSFVRKIHVRFFLLSLAADNKEDINGGEITSRNAEIAAGSWIGHRKRRSRLLDETFPSF